MITENSLNFSHDHRGFLLMITEVFPIFLMITEDFQVFFHDHLGFPNFSHDQ